MNEGNEIINKILTNQKYITSNILVLNNSYEYDQISLLDYLLDNNYSISVSTDPEELKNSITKRKADLILIITKEIDSNSLKLVREIKSQPKMKNLPVFFIASYSNKIDKVSAFNSGANDFIDFESHPSEIISRMKIHLNFSQKLRAMEDEIANNDLTLTLIAHDLKGPLSYILNMSKLLNDQDHILESEERAQISHTIYMATQKLHLLLTNLLDWRNVHQGKSFYRPIKINLYKTVAIILNMIESIAQSKNLNILNKIPIGMEIFADEIMLNSIIRNLVLNAVKFSRDDGIIKIEAVKIDHNTEVTISDNGIGMPKEQLENLFTKSSLKIMPGTQNESGTGIGLMLCYEFVKKHGGKIWAESKLDQGSRFSFRLPDYFH